MTPDSLLVTMDVNSLHTNIPHSDGVEACRSFHTMNTIDKTLINDIPTLVEIHVENIILVCFTTNSISKSMAQPWEKNGSNIHQYFYALC